MTKKTDTVAVHGAFLIATSITIIILGLLIATVGWFILPVCSATMKCGYTASAETAVGSLLVLVGAVLLFTKTSEARVVSGAVGLGIGTITILLPTYIIGVCDMATMPCRVGTEPALIILGAITIIISAILIIKNLRSNSAKQ